MRIFISYATEQERTAEELHSVLKKDDHEVFCASSSLPGSNDYTREIRAEIEACELFIFMVSPDSVAAGGYALSELLLAERNDKQILPVEVVEVATAELPPGLSTVTVMSPKGNLVAEVAARVAELAQPSSQARRKWIRIGLWALVLGGVLVAILLYLRGCNESSGEGDAPQPPTSASKAYEIVVDGSARMGEPLPRNDTNRRLELAKKVAEMRLAPFVRGTPVQVRVTAGCTGGSYVPENTDLLSALGQLEPDGKSAVMASLDEAVKNLEARYPDADSTERRILLLFGGADECDRGVRDALEDDIYTWMTKEGGGQVCPIAVGLNPKAYKNAFPKISRLIDEMGWCKSLGRNLQSLDEFDLRLRCEETNATTPKGTVIDFDDGYGVMRLPPQSADSKRAPGFELGNHVHCLEDGLIRISARSPSGYPESARLFDATCSGGCAGGDDDLNFPEQRNILILPGNGRDARPGDSASGGVLTFDFSRLSNSSTVTVESLRLLDLDSHVLDKGDRQLCAQPRQSDSKPLGVTEECVAACAANMAGVIRGYTDTDRRYREFLPKTANNDSRIFGGLDFVGIDRLEVELCGAGAIDDIQFRVGPA